MQEARFAVTAGHGDICGATNLPGLHQRSAGRRSGRCRAFRPSLILLVGFLIVTPSLLRAGDLPAQDTAWTFEIEPYLLFTSIEGNASMGRILDVPLDVDFGQILDNLDGALMLHFEAHNRSGWGFWLDYGGMNLKGKRSGPREIGTLEAGVKQGILEAVVQYRKEHSRWYYDIFGGIRWWDNELHVKLLVGEESRSRNRSESWVDPMIGVRWGRTLSKSSELRLQADVAGFGIGADFSSALSAAVYWSLGRVVQIKLAYKALWVDYAAGSEGQPDHFTYTTWTHGPVLGVNFRF